MSSWLRRSAEARETPVVTLRYKTEPLFGNWNVQSNLLVSTSVCFQGRMSPSPIQLGRLQIGLWPWEGDGPSLFPTESCYFWLLWGCGALGRGMWRVGGKGVRKVLICLVVLSHAFQIFGVLSGADLLFRAPDGFSGDSTAALNSHSIPLDTSASSAPGFPTIHSHRPLQLLEAT